MDGTIGEIRGFAGNFAPRTWAFCNGQLLNISQNDALFSILGTTFGGDGRTTFGLPDLRGRIPMHAGTGPGLTTVDLGERGGHEFTNLTLGQMPQHSHTATATVNVLNGDGDKRAPGGNIIAGDNTTSMFSDLAANGTLNASSVTVAVGNTGVGGDMFLRNPFTGINMIICMVGIYPSRN